MKLGKKLGSKDWGPAWRPFFCTKKPAMLVSRLVGQSGPAVLRFGSDGLGRWLDICHLVGCSTGLDVDV